MLYACCVLPGSYLYLGLKNHFRLISNEVSLAVMHRTHVPRVSSSILTCGCYSSFARIIKVDLTGLYKK